MITNHDRIIEECGHCRQRIDVTEAEPFALVECPGCGQPVRVRAAFHHFEILEQIGTGGMSRVFRARDASLGRDVALKILNRECSQDEKRARQFEQEAEITARMGHPNVVRVYTAGRDQGHFYIAMELVGGGSLEGALRDRGKLKEGHVLELAAQMVQGLKAAHEAGLIHRDIKPGNILLSDDGTPKIVDFGLALFARDADGSGDIWATPYYVPPETLHHAPEDFRSDIYSLGATLYHLLLGKPPCNKDTNSLEELKQIKSHPIHVKPAVAKLSEETCAMLERSMAIRAGDRYRSYAEFLDHLRFAQRRLRRGGKGRPWPGRVKKGMAPWQWAAAAGIAVAAGSGLFMALQKEKPVQQGGGMQGSLVTDADPTAGSDSSTSNRFLTARDAMQAGDFGKARQYFEEIGGNTATHQPTRNWARWNAGLCALLMEDAAGAKTIYKALAAEPLYSQGAGEAELANFFSRTSQQLSAEGTVSAGFRNDCPPDSVRAIGLLAAGLKHWQAGETAQGTALMEAFETSTPPQPTGAWVENAKKLASPWLDDVRALRTLTRFAAADVEKMPAAEAEAALSSARAALEKMKRPGLARDKAAAALATLAQAVEKRTQAVAMQEGTRRDVDVNAEFQLVHDTTAAAASLGESYRFMEAAAKLRALPVQSPEATALRDAHAGAWEKSAQFLEQLLKDIAARPMEGVVTDAKGQPVLAVLSASEGAISARLPQGAELKVVPGKMAPASLLALGEDILATVSDSDDYYRRREMLYFFALHSGRKGVAAAISTSLSREYAPFRERLAALNTVGISTSGLPDGDVLK
jgi:eukaryotic-like serine/threonine-protein kinase